MCVTELLTFSVCAVCVAKDTALIMEVIMALNSHTVPRLSVQITQHHHIVLRPQDLSLLQGQSEQEMMSLSSNTAFKADQSRPYHKNVC